MSKDNSKNNLFFQSQEEGNEDNVYLSIAKSKENWRRIAFIIGLYAFLATGALTFRAFQSKFRPYIVKVNTLGMPVQYGPAKSVNHNRERLIRAQLFQWLQQIRSISGSKAFLKNQMQKAFALLSSDVAEQLNEYFSVGTHDPRNLINKYSRDVTIRSIVRLNKKKNKWKIRWIETLYPKNSNKPIQRQGWVAYLSLKLDPPETSEGILKNPLGIYITSLSWRPNSPEVNIN